MEWFYIAYTATGEISTLIGFWLKKHGHSTVIYSVVPHCYGQNSFSRPSELPRIGPLRPFDEYFYLKLWTWHSNRPTISIKTWTLNWIEFHAEISQYIYSTTKMVFGQPPRIYVSCNLQNNTSRIQPWCRLEAIYDIYPDQAEGEKSKATEIYDLIGQTKITINKKEFEASISEHGIGKLWSC